jgi:hypothetical protein
VGRCRVTMLLEFIKAFSNDPNEWAAANHIRMRAARAWYGPSLSFSKDLLEGPRTDCGQAGAGLGTPVGNGRWAATVDGPSP